MIQSLVLPSPKLKRYSTAPRGLGTTKKVTSVLTSTGGVGLTSSIAVNAGSLVGLGVTVGVGLRGTNLMALRPPEEVFGITFLRVAPRFNVSDVLGV
ncbi:MAG: hypothetical protein DMF02_08315 [Verrucomicrobia bacterium]|nr:MAG: hypothetical protein DMF02_08315 [Verrucomicrobiota bacterium]